MILRLLWLQPQPPRLPLAQPFLYAKLGMTSPSPAMRRPKGLVPRILAYGEAKWHGLAACPGGSLRGRIYRLGGLLIDRIPVQERMLWRVQEYVRWAALFRAPLPPIECGAGGAAPEHIRAAMDTWVRHHWRWRLVHGCAILPAVLLSVLPFVKMWLAWEVFRTVTHHRALVGAQWLRGQFKGSVRPSSQLDGPPEQIDGELPALLARLGE